MVKLTILYKKPESTQAFDEHYQNVHMPIVYKMPGLKKSEIAKVTGSPMGESPYYVITELYFDSLADLQTALSSEAGRASAKDVNNFAKGLAEMFISEVEKVPAGFKA